MCDNYGDSGALPYATAIGFIDKMMEDEKNKLLRKYWTIPVRQIETSVVLASSDWEGE